jgi:hypothetical protein
MLGADEDEVRQQLQRLADSLEFVRAQRMLRFLRYVFAKTLARDPGALRERQIGIEIFDRPADWDPKQDNIVRSEARRLREKLDTYAARRDPYETVRITIPTGGMAPSSHGSRVTAGQLQRRVRHLHILSGAPGFTSCF